MKEIAIKSNNKYFENSSFFRLRYMIVLNLIFLEVQFECDFLIKNLVKIPVYRYADDGIPVFAIPILFMISSSVL